MESAQHDRQHQLRFARNHNKQIFFCIYFKTFIHFLSFLYIKLLLSLQNTINEYVFKSIEPSLLKFCLFCLYLLRYTDVTLLL